MTPDADAPVLRLDSPAPAGFTKQKRPTVRVVVEDALSGPDASRASLQLDGFPVTPRAQREPAHPRAGLRPRRRPPRVEATAHDRAGNPGSLVAELPGRQPAARAAPS